MVISKKILVGANSVKFGLNKVKNISKCTRANILMGKLKLEYTKGEFRFHKMDSVEVFI